MLRFVLSPLTDFTKCPCVTVILILIKRISTDFVLHLFSRLPSIFPLPVLTTTTDWSYSLSCTLIPQLVTRDVTISRLSLLSYDIFFIGTSSSVSRLEISVTMLNTQKFRNRLEFEGLTVTRIEIFILVNGLNDTFISIQIF